MANSNDKEEFNNLIKQLEYLHYKNNQLKKMMNIIKLMKPWIQML